MVFHKCLLLSAFLFYKPEAVPAIFKDLNADHQRMFDMIKESGLKWVAILPPHIAGMCKNNEEVSPLDILEKSHQFYMFQIHQNQSILSHSILRLDAQSPNTIWVRFSLSVL